MTHRAEQGQPGQEWVWYPRMTICVPANIMASCCTNAGTSTGRCSMRHWGNAKFMAMSCASLILCLCFCIRLLLASSRQGPSAPPERRRERGGIKEPSLQQLRMLHASKKLAAVMLYHCLQIPLANPQVALWCRAPSDCAHDGAGMSQPALVAMLRSRARKSSTQTSHFRGVSLLKQTSKWHAQINVGGKQVLLSLTSRI